MNNIKFRGKNEKTGQWQYGYLYLNNGVSADNRKFYITDGETHSPADENTVGQYTTLCDRQGREIYEGDIMETERGATTLIVFWKEFGFHFRFIYDLDTAWPVVGCKNLTVVGNIHDDPEKYKW